MEKFAQIFLGRQFEKLSRKYRFKGKHI